MALYTILSLLLFSLIATPVSAAAIPLKAVVSIVPQKYFVEKIGGKLVAVTVMVEPGASPETYEPRAKQMVELSEADLYFAVGVPFEGAWLKKIAATNPEMRVVHTDEDIEKIPMEVPFQEGQPIQTGRKAQSRLGSERESIKDPHIWLSPPLVKIQAHIILEALQAADPIHRSEFERNYEKFSRELDEIDAELRADFAGKEGLAFLVFHPAWGYFARTYGLQQVPVEIEGKEPKPAQIRALIEFAQKNDIKIVFVQPQFSTKHAQLVADAIGGQLVFADPLAADWSRNLREVAGKFAAVLR
jgi:zinc transport system substrate-binding protein